MKIIKTTSLTVSITILAAFHNQLNITLLLITGGILSYGLLSRFFNMQKEINLLKEETQYFIDSFRSIRNPISLIHTPLKTVCDENCPERIKKDILMAVHNMNYLDRQLTGLMSLKHMFVHSESVDMAEYELGNLLKNRVDSLREYAANKQVTLKIETKFGYTSVWVDHSKISPVIDRFVKNAIDYAERENCITISASLYQEHWEIRITDSGNGKLMRCYNCKKRQLVRRRIEREYGFTKSILCRKLMELCGGKILINDSSHTVSLHFPVKCPHGKVTGHIANSHITACREEEKIDTQFRETPQKRSSGKPVVVLADSNEEFRFYLETRLSDDYIIKSFENGAEALAYIKEEHPDLVVSDTVLHEMSGNELSSRLKTSRVTSIIPVILYGSQVDIDQRYKREASLADVFLQDSFHIEDLKIEMSVLIRNSRFLRKSFLQKVFGEQFLQERETGSRNNYKDTFIDRVKDFILENIEEEHLTIKVIASNFGMSQTAFYNKWKSLTGESPSYIISHIRMEKGRELLESGTYNVNEIPEMIGMKDVKYFRSEFKKYFKITPHESIKKNRQ